MMNSLDELLEISTVQKIPEELKTRIPEEPISKKYVRTALKVLLATMLVFVTLSFLTILLKCEMGHQRILTVYFYGIVLLLTMGAIIMISEDMRL